MITLSRRQSECLALLEQRFSNADIGKTLGVSRNTVANHLAEVYRKLAVKGRLQAVTKNIVRANYSIFLPDSHRRAANPA